MVHDPGQHVRDRRPVAEEREVAAEHVERAHHGDAVVADRLPVVEHRARRRRPRSAGPRPRPRPRRAASSDRRTGSSSASGRYDRASGRAPVAVTREASLAGPTNTDAWAPRSRTCRRIRWTGVGTSGRNVVVNTLSARLVTRSSRPSRAAARARARASRRALSRRSAGVRRSTCATSTAPGFARHTAMSCPLA